MKKCIFKLISSISSFWRTLVSTFVRKHLYKKDVDADGYSEIVIDVNGEVSSHKQENSTAQEDNYDI